MNLIDEIIEVNNEYTKFNNQLFQLSKANRIAERLIREYGFKDQKYFSHLEKRIDTYNWNKGQGTIYFDNGNHYIICEIGHCDIEGMEYKGRFNLEIY